MKAVTCVRNTHDHKFHIGRACLGAVALLGALLPGGLFAHDVKWDVSRQQSGIVLAIHYGDGTLFAFEQYEVFAPGTDIAFQVGRTDALGRVVFVPDREGAWKVKFVSDDGHGGEALVPVDKEGTATVQRLSLFQQFGPAISGAGLILGLTGLYMLLKARRLRA